MATVHEIEIPRNRLTRAIKPTAGQFIRRAREVAVKKGFKPHQVTYCIDGVPHSFFGRNKRFVLMQDEKKPDAVYLAKEHKKGIEVLPATYLGSALIKGTISAPRYVHFIAPTKPHTLREAYTNTNAELIRGELLRTAIRK